MQVSEIRKFPGELIIKPKDETNILDLAYREGETGGVFYVMIDKTIMPFEMDVQQIQDFKDGLQKLVEVYK